MATIEVGDGKTMLVDNADVAMLSGFTLQLVMGGTYVRADRGSFLIYVHRLIAGAAPEEIVDHINGDGLDNRTANLRITNKSGNGANRGANRRSTGTTSKHKGVVRKERKRGVRWMAYIHSNKKTRYLGTYDTEDEAGAAYNAAALEQFGEMARLNIIEGEAA